MSERVDVKRGAGVVLAGVLAIVVSATSCASGRYDGNVDNIAKPYAFSIARWELTSFFSWHGHSSSEDEAGEVVHYFALAQQVNALQAQIEAVRNGGQQGDLSALQAELSRLEYDRASLRDDVEYIIKKQVKETLVREGILNPLDRYIKLNVGFPPVKFRLEPPPHVLVVSPRDKIEELTTVSLRQEMTVAQMESVESSVDRLGVSSLVTDVGGFGGTYPTLVTSDGDLEFTLETVIHEWLHQYLVFKPLGYRYALDRVGAAPNPDIATMNETLVSIASKEITAHAMQQYYPSLANPSPKPPGAFNFDQKMRNIRKTVGDYLAAGQIDQAERYMEERRQFLVSKGYYIRKLNQAYFAFNDTYADRPGSISPIGIQLQTLRTRTASVKDFLDTAGALTSAQQLASIESSSP